MKEKTLILKRKDMIEYNQGKDIHFIEATDFKISVKEFQKNSIILFIDDNEDKLILKNRFKCIGDLIAHIVISGMDPDYEITLNGKGIGQRAIELLP